MRKYNHQENNFDQKINKHVKSFIISSKNKSICFVQ